MKQFAAWVKDTALRAIKTAAQSAGALVTANTIGLTSVSWEHVGDVAGLAAVVCVLHNLSTLQLKGDVAALPLVVTTVQTAAPIPASTFPTAPPVDIEQAIAASPDDDTPDDAAPAAA